MALPTRVQGGVRPSLSITWTRDDGTAEDLTGATLSGSIRERATQTTRPVAGALVVTDGSAGVFRWDLAAGDVAAAGQFDVQFTAAFAAGQTPARSFVERWMVSEALA